MADPESEDADRELVVGETADGNPYTLPVEDVLTGRAFATGKSGSGKSNTGSVIAEELLDRGHPLLVVDVDGEYYSLKEEYELLHVGATEQCDLRVGPEHAPKLAELALDQHVPIVLDVSGFVDGDTADELVRETARELFAREQEAMQPFLMLVEEIHEYIPQQGSLGETGDMLIRIAKRGRKRGLGIMGLSQRPADVKKDFITQADLLVWHRLTWDNDTDVVARVIDREHADQVGDLVDGEAFVQADWSEAEVERVQFRRKETFDAGATPGLDDVDRPELKSIGEDLVDELEEISDEHQRRQDRIAQLEQRLDEKDERIEELKQERDQARDVGNAAQQFVDALQGAGADADAGVPEDFEDQLAEKNEEIHALEEDLAAVREERDALQERVDRLESEIERLQSYEDRVEEAERIEDRLQEIEAWFASAPAPLRESGEGDVQIQGGEAVDEALQERVAELEAENERLREEGTDADAGDDLGALVQHDAVQAAVDVAKDNSDRADEHFDRALAVLASSDGGPLAADEIVPLMDDVSSSTVNAVLRSLFDAGVVQREKDGKSYEYELDEEFLQRRIEVAEQTSS